MNNKIETFSVSKMEDCMSKVKVILGVLLVIILGIFLFQNRALFSGNAKSSDVKKILNQNESNAEAKHEAYLKENTPSPQKIETELKKSGKFTEGVWIKKYPDNYACFKFETPDGLKIIADPYNMNETVHPDIVTESHQHIDHTDVSKLTMPYKLIRDPENFTQKGIKITGISGKHNKGDMSGTNSIFIFEINGIKIAHFASQGELPSDEVLNKMKNIDVLLIQASIEPDYLQGKLTLQECDHIIKILNPKIVIPEHGTPYISVAFAKYFNKLDEYASSGEIVVTRSSLDSISSFKIIDLDTNITF